MAELCPLKSNHLFSADRWFVCDAIRLFEQEALRHFNQTAAQKQMLTFARKYLEMDDAVRLKTFLNCVLFDFSLDL